MNRAYRWLFATSLAVSAVAARGATASWSEMKTGLNRDQVARVLGWPVLRQAARGHETWIYDGGAGVQFHRGLVSAWTGPKAPAGNAAPAPREPANAARQTAESVSRPQPSSPRPS